MIFMASDLPKRPKRVRGEPACTSVSGLTRRLAWLRSDTAASRRRGQAYERRVERAMEKGAGPEVTGPLVDALVDAQADAWHGEQRIEKVKEIRDAFRRRVPADKCIGAAEAERVYSLELRRAMREDAELRRDEYQNDLDEWARARRIIRRLRSSGFNWSSLDAFEGALDTKGHRMILTANIKGMPRYKSDGRQADAQDVWEDWVHELAQRPKETDEPERALFEAVEPGLQQAPQWSDYVGGLTPESEAELERLAGRIREMLEGRGDA